LVVDTIKALKKARSVFAKAGASAFGIDIESSGKRWPGSRMAGIGIWAEATRKGIYLPVEHADSQVLPIGLVMEFIKSICEQASEIWMHNAAFEGKAFLHYGYSLPDHKVRDSMAAAALLKEQMGLKPLAVMYTGRDPEDTLPNTDMTQVPAAISAPYCIRDCSDSVDIGRIFIPRLDKLGMLKVFRDLECPVTQLIAHMEYVGFRIDVKKLSALSVRVKAEMARHQEQVFKILGYEINLNSGKQLGDAFVTDRGLWPEALLGRTKSGMWKSDRKTLQLVAQKAPSAMGKRAAEHLVDHGMLSHLNGAFIDGLMKRLMRENDFRVRAQFRQFGADTGRASSADPNMQNIPRPGEDMLAVRSAFISETGWSLVDSDYSQVELVLLAHYSQDAKMLAVYRAGGDIHATTAKEITGGDRQGAKPVNFGLVYGMGWKTLMNSALKYGVKMSPTDAKRYVKLYFEKYEGVGRWHQRVKVLARKFGYVRTLSGRVRWIDGANSSNFREKGEAERQAINTRIQGSAADLLKIALRNLKRRFEEAGELWHPGNPKGRVRLISQVHDEIIAEARDDYREEASAIMQEVMESAVKLTVPLVAEPSIGKTWMETK